MSTYRQQLPQLDNTLFITDAGLETALIFHEGVDLPHFAAFDLLRDPVGVEHMWRYYRRYAEIANRFGRGLILESPTWRANSDWGRKLGYDRQQLAAVNRQAIDLMVQMREEFATPSSKVVISGCIGPRGDGYRVDRAMSVDEAWQYHSEQIDTFAQTDADLVTVFTMNYVEEAVGVALAARAAKMPAVISFTLETDGRLPSGLTLAQAIERTDAETGQYPAYYMINCAHPTHFQHVLQPDAGWTKRLRGLRANASKRSHAELDEAANLDAGNPTQLASEYRSLQALLPSLAVVGGCCGTDHRHVESICAAFAAADSRKAA